MSWYPTSAFYGPARKTLVGLALVLLAAPSAMGAPRYTVCSITINSDDEIHTFQKRLPASEFDFVELTDGKQATPVDGTPDWLTNACQSGVRCDALVLSGHFSNTYLGSFGTTFAGTKGLSLPLEDLEARSCEQSCPGILSSPLEVFLLACRTLATSLEDEALLPSDLALLASHHVPPRVAERLVEEISYGGEDTSNRARMRFVFSGVPEIDGFVGVAPIGKSAAPRLEKYLRSGDYANHLGQLRAARNRKQTPAANRALEHALDPSTFLQSSGLDIGGLEHGVETRACLLGSERSSVLARLGHMEQMLEEPGFIAYLRAMGSFFRDHDPAKFSPDEVAVLTRIRNHSEARKVVSELVRQLRSPVLRQEILRVSRAIGWIPEEEGLRLQREIVLQLLKPPIYGKQRDLICGIPPEVIQRIGIRADDIPAETYRDEYGIQALGCLKSSDQEIYARLALSLSDPREWISRLTAIALKGMN